jgi:hypothetical protein
MFVEKVFQLITPFLANMHSSSSKKYTVYVLNDPKKFVFLFLHMGINIMQNFMPISNPWKYLEKSACQKKLFTKLFCKLVV